MAYGRSKGAPQGTESGGCHLMTHFLRVRSGSASPFGAELLPKDEQKEQTKSSSVCHLASVFHATPKCMTNGGREVVMQRGGIKENEVQQTAEGEKRVKSEDGDTTASGGQASVDAVSQGSRAALLTRRPLTLAEGLIHLRLADQCSKPLLARVEAFNVSRPFTRPSIHHRTDAHMQHIKAHYENEREEEGSSL